MSSSAPVATKSKQKKSDTASGPVVHRVAEHTVEVVSDSGEGAQKCAQSFGMVSAKMGNGVWTVEIIPAEIQPPARSPAGASGNRVRLGTRPVTNWGMRRTSSCLQRAGAAGAPSARRPARGRDHPGREHVGDPRG